MYLEQNKNKYQKNLLYIYNRNRTKYHQEILDIWKWHKQIDFPYGKN